MSDLEEALEVIACLLEQHCDDGDEDLDSFALSANANAMRFLQKFGWFEVTEADVGRRVIGKITRP